MAEQAQKTEIMPLNERQEVAVIAPTPLQIFAQAMEKGIDIDKMKVLREMVEWHEDREAEKAFNEAMSKFRSEAITIVKNKRVGYDHRDGQGSTAYSHATLDAVVDAAVPRLSAHGLSHRWETEQRDGNIVVTCILTHRLGHSQRTTLAAGPDTSGKKNSIQAIGSTVSYLERYTFMAATGLAAKGQDDDGQGGTPPPENITAAQAGIIDKLIKETKTDQATFLNWAHEGATELDQIPASRLNECMRMLNHKKREQQAAAKKTAAKAEG